MITLSIDASTYVGDVAVLDGSRVLEEIGVAMRGADEERLMPAVVALLARARLGVRDVGRVVCGEGPGSFTSLRIAGAIAKGIAIGVPCPLFALPSMALIIAGSDVGPGRYLVAVDALRDQFYLGLFAVSATGAIQELERPRLTAACDVAAVADQLDARLVSPAVLARSITALPRARGAGRLQDMLVERGPVRLDAWEPAYGRLAEAQVRWESANGRPLPPA